MAAGKVKVEPPAPRTCATWCLLLLAAALVSSWWFSTSELLSQKQSVSLQFEVTLGHAVVFVSFTSLMSLAIAFLVYFRKAVAVHKTSGKRVSTSSSSSSSTSSSSAAGSATSGAAGSSPRRRSSRLPLASAELIRAYSDELEEDDAAAAADAGLVARLTRAGRQAVDLNADVELLYRLASSKFISDLTPEEFAELYRDVEWLHLRPETVLFREGDSSDDGMYVVVSGEIGVYRREDDELHLIRTFTMGDSIGEFALLTGEDRYMTCVTLCKTSLIKVTREVYNAFVRERPHKTISFVRTTLSSQWRVATFVLDTFLSLPPPLESRVFSRTLDSLLEPDDPILAALRPEALEQHRRDGAESSDSDDPDQPVRPHVMDVGPGRTLVEAGSMDNRLFVLVSGLLVLEDPHDSDEPIELRPGTVIGAVEFLTTTAHSRTIRATIRSTVVWLTASQLARPDMSSLVLGMTKAVCMVIGPTLRQFVSLGFQREMWRSGESVFRRGDPASHVYITVSGHLKMMRPLPEGGRETLFEIGMGECSGEVSFLSGEAEHGHDLVCVRDSEMVKVSRIAFELMRDSHPQVLDKLTQIMASRFRQSLSAESRARSNVANIKTIAIVPTSAHVDVRAFCEKLSEQLSEHGPTAHVTVEQVDKLLGRGTCKMDHNAHRGRVQVWLSELEETNRFLVLECDVAEPAWTKWALRSADRILLLADGSDDPAVSEFEQVLLWSSGARKLLARKELVLLHPPDTVVPSGTRFWLQPRHCHIHHHIRVGHDAHYSRLARILAGRAWGVVLSGGGARGLAHMGVVKAMRELNVSVDYIAGTSQGSFMAALYSIYEDVATVEQHTHVMAKRLSNMWDLLSDATIPVMSYFSGKQLNSVVQSILGEDRCIEDLWIHFFCVTTNISGADLNVHLSGSLWRAVRSSMSVLDYLPPMHDGQNILIDGGYISNMPVDTMRTTFSPWRILAVDVENKDLDVFADIPPWGDTLSGLGLIWQKVKSALPCTKTVKVPRFSELVSSLTYINHNRQMRQFFKQRLMDIYIRPDLGNAKLLDYHKIDEIIQLGYQAAQTEILGWQAKQADKRRESSQTAEPTTSYLVLQDSRAGAEGAVTALRPADAATLRRRLYRRRTSAYQSPASSTHRLDRS